MASRGHTTEDAGSKDNDDDDDDEDAGKVVVADVSHGVV